MFRKAIRENWRVVRVGVGTCWRILARVCACWCVLVDRVFVNASDDYVSRRRRPSWPVARPPSSTTARSERGQKCGVCVARRPSARRPTRRTLARRLAVELEQRLVLAMAPLLPLRLLVLAVPPLLHLHRRPRAASSRRRCWTSRRPRPGHVTRLTRRFRLEAPSRRRLRTSSRLSTTWRRRSEPTS